MYLDVVTTRVVWCIRRATASIAPWAEPASSFPRTSRASGSSRAYVSSKNTYNPVHARDADMRRDCSVRTKRNVLAPQRDLSLPAAHEYSRDEHVPYRASWARDCAPGCSTGLPSGSARVRAECLTDGQANRLVQVPCTVRVDAFTASNFRIGL